MQVIKQNNYIFSKPINKIINGWLGYCYDEALYVMGETGGGNFSGISSIAD